MSNRSMLFAVFVGVVCVTFSGCQKSDSQGIREIKEQLEDLKLVDQKRLGLTQTTKELHDLFYELRAKEEGRIEKILVHEEALKKHLSDGLLNELNQKINNITIFETEEDEVIVRASTFKQFNAVLDKLIDNQNQVTTEFEDQNEKNMLRAAELGAVIANKKAELEELKQAEMNILQEAAGELEDVNTRLAEVKKRIAGKVDLRKEQEISLFEQLLDRIEALEAENKKLKN